MSTLPVHAPILRGTPPDDDTIRDLVAGHRARLGVDGSARATETLRSAVLGAGPLQALLGEADVTDVVVNGDGRVWVDRGDGLVPHPTLRLEAGALRRLAVRLAALGGRRLDDASPYVDARLPDGVRLHAILPPLVEHGPHLSLRVPPRRSPTLGDLRARNSIDQRLHDLLRSIVEARLNVLVSGGTGAGKTTVLAALLSAAAPRERIVVVEDVPELSPAHPHVVRLSARAANVEGHGAVDLSTLVRQSLRMRPDRLILGEVRGSEIRDLLTALNTGHDGGGCTVHANSVHDVVARCEALAALAGSDPATTRAHVAGALDVVVHVRRGSYGRYVAGIATVHPDGRGCRIVPVLRAERGEHGTRSSVVDPEGWQALTDRCARRRERS